ncbi:unnamed protein product [Staurois parvus]|uniref:G-protein coupled receptors family 1 profile domain-containing protein n=1 Tax=Staurois parvus TaxID=386267 RepID=A0ABN9HIF5_9NEOB|nr:unnamed protein product [Staurois parvus]
MAPLQSLSCSDPSISRLVTILTATFAIILPSIIITAFYVHIINAILKIKGAEGKQKAFSTCSSHLIVSSLFFGSALVVYSIPSRGENDKFLALIYTVLTPLLNPFIYTFRNSDVKKAVNKICIKYVYPVVHKPHS